METLRLPSCARLATFAVLLSPIFAQNTTLSGSPNTTRGDQHTCQPSVSSSLSPDAPVNSTGNVNLHWNALMMDPSRNDWKLTLTYNETRSRDASTIHYLQSYISVPEESEAKTCVTMFTGLNATSPSGRRNGCDGVLNDACISILQTALYNDDCSLPGQPGEFLNQVREACGSDITSESVTSGGRHKDFTNKTCSISHPPGSSSPDNYRTWMAHGVGVDANHVDQNASDFTWYDLYNKQTIPFIIFSEFFGGIAETQVACVAPREVVGESRVPVAKSAASGKWLYPSWPAWIVAASVGLVFTVP